MRLLGLIVVLGACGNSSTAIDATTTATAMQACMHICTCEANAPGTPGTTDAMCQTDCQASQGPFSTSISMSTSTLGTSFSTTAGGVDFAGSEQACVNCFANAACSAIVAGTVCADQCH